MLSRFIITFLPRSKCLLISWLQSPSAVILEHKNKVWHCFHCFTIYFPWSDGTGCHDLRFQNVELSANFFTLLFHFHQEAFLWAHKPFLPESRPAYMMKNSWLWGKHCTWCRELTTVWVSFQVGGGTRVRGQCVFAANGEPYFTLWAFHLDWRLKVFLPRDILSSRKGQKCCSTPRFTA